MAISKGFILKGIFILFGFAFVGTLATSDSLPASSLDNQLLNLNTSTQCGETLDEESGIIWYNYPGPYLSNHRCSWILRVENASGYNISVFGFSPPHNNSHQVTFTGFNYDNINRTQFYLLNDPSDIFFEIRFSNIVVITLQTLDNGDITTHGVALSYNATYAQTISKPSPASRDFHLAPTKETQTFDFPEAGISSANQMSAFLFSPFNNTFQHWRPTTALVQNNGIISNCDHVFHVYIYTTYNGKWIYDHNSCDLNEVKMVHDDNILLLFISNDMSQGANFSISYRYDILPFYG